MPGARVSTHFRIDSDAFLRHNGPQNECLVEYPMPKERSDTQRFQTMLSVETIKYLEMLAVKGTHGSSVPAVGRTLIEEGIRSAIKQGFISLK